MGVVIKQYEGSLVSPKDDAILHDLFNNRSGVIKGCEITHLGENQLRVGDGYLYIQGRMIEVEEETVISPFANQTSEGELILNLDLLSETPGKLVARVPRANLKNEDINGNGNECDYLLATYTIANKNITNLSVKYQTLKPNTEEMLPKAAFTLSGDTLNLTL